MTQENNDYERGYQAGLADAMAQAVQLGIGALETQIKEIAEAIGWEGGADRLARHVMDYFAERGSEKHIRQRDALRKMDAGDYDPNAEARRQENSRWN